MRLTEKQLKEGVAAYLDALEGQGYDKDPRRWQEKLWADADQWWASMTLPDADVAWGRLTALAETTGWKVKVLTTEQALDAMPGAPWDDQTEGMTDMGRKWIVIKEGLPVAARVAVLAHELGHALGKIARTIREYRLPVTRPVQELAETEAELVSAQVMAEFGIQPNWSYFVMWTKPEMVEALWQDAWKVSRRVLAALRPERFEAVGRAA